MKPRNDAILKTRNPKLASLLAISAVAGMIAIPFAALAGEQMQIAFLKVNKGDKFELVLDDKNTGRMVFFTNFRSTFKQTKGGDLFDGVNNSGGGYADFTQGRGNITGFDVNEKDGDSFKAGWAGNCYSLNGSDGKPVAHCAGGWFAVSASGTGRFSGLSGGGQWSGRALPNGDFEVTMLGTVEK